MTPRERLKSLIAEARQAIAARQIPLARRLLAAVQADPERAALGQRTVLGLPRQLQAAHLSLAKAEGDRMARLGYQYHLVPPPEVLAPLGAFTTAQRQAIAAANRVEMPRVLHQIWIGPKPPTVTTAFWAEHAAAQGYRYRLWREPDLSAAGIAGQPAYTAMMDRGDYPGAVDVARYAILLAEGGLYLDCDWLPARDDIGFQDRMPLIGLTALGEAVPRLTGQGPLLLANSLIGAPPRHPVLARLVEVLPRAIAALPGAPAWWSTGPLLFTVVALGGGSVSLADPGLVAGHLPREADPQSVRQARLRAKEDDAGLLLAWKPW